MRRCILLFSTSLLTGLTAVFAQEDTTHLSLMESSLERLLTTTVNQAPQAGGQQSGIADLIDQDIREAPGVIQVFTTTGMEIAGGPSLEDALILIPGFLRGHDVSRRVQSPCNNCLPLLPLAGRVCTSKLVHYFPE